ncbi:galactokinase [Aeoliella mucimassa]|uniref:Galactokinase n=1 Tax=Aeoliella mucimassa TaxID=2527972 RepID=A0A518AJM2_9BACT|nr:galactokinase [Aeoliella mucimassa]QDU54932.1 Galactokinase [Aeoliella mucimassa]
MLPAVPLEQMIATVKQQYSDRYQQPPTWVVSAPGRVNLIGEHTDYNDGFVMPMAIERYVVIAAGPAEGTGNTLRVSSDAMEGEITIDVDQPVPDDLPQWGIYVRGVLVEMLEAGFPCGALQATIHANVPLGGGLSSSAALEVATATMVEAAVGKSLGGPEVAKLCQRAENIHVGMPCGIMDQFSSAVCEADHLMQLDCRSLATKQVPFTNPDITVLIINTNVKRELASSAYPIRRGQCETAAKQLGVKALRDATMPMLDKMAAQIEEVVYRRARHVITENRRVEDMATALETNNWALAGELMYASHDSLRDDYEVSCDELNLLVDTAHQIGTNGGVIGSRLTGAGFGGCTVTLVETEAVEDVAKRLKQTYQTTLNIEPTLFTTRPGKGAHIAEG